MKADVTIIVPVRAFYTVTFVQWGFFAIGIIYIFSVQK